RERNQNHRPGLKFQAPVEIPAFVKFQNSAAIKFNLAARDRPNGLSRLVINGGIARLKSVRYGDMRT
ncbi:hypothetical protein, partial [uncultured Campylobacter sp.]|uniref:hypothetical protein n=1 Tax=uncultured Campylobacter sp. TaxID=218934 RepID=UPI0026046206